MASIQIFLESGFDHDEVTVDAAGAEHVEPDVTTRYQIGLARVIDVTVPDGEASTVRVTVGHLTAEAEVTPEATPYVYVNVAENGLAVRPEAAPPMYA